MRMQRLQKAVPCNSPLLSEALARLERSEFRLCMLTAANKAFASTLDVDACIDGIVRLIVPKLSSWCILDIGGGSAAFARTGVFQANDGGPVKVDLNSSSPAGTSWQPLFDVLRTALPKRCAQPLGPSLLQHARDIKQQPIVNESGLGAIIVLPIDFCGSRQGTLMLAAGGSRCSYTLDDVELALALMALMNNALERAVLSQSAAVESAERRRAETRFQRLLEAAPDAMVIAGPDGEILVVNSQTEALFGFERRELIGQQIEILLPPALRPDYALRLAEYLAQAETQPHKGSLEVSALRKDGSLFPAEIMLSQLDSEEGVLLTAAIRDVSRRVAAEQQLRLITTALDQLQDAVIIMTPETRLPGPRFVYVNPAFSHMTGYGSADVLGRPLSLLQGPQTDRAALARLRRTLGRGGAYSGEILNYRQDGTSSWTNWRVSPVRDLQGTITHWVSVQHDVTADKARQEQLRRTDRLTSLGTLAAGIAHELNNPIAAALLTAEATRATLPVDSDNRLAVCAVVDSLQRCKQIIKEMLWFSSGQPTAHTLHGLNALVKQAVRLVGTYATEQHATLDLSLREPLPEVLVNRLEVEMALANLLHNAIQSRSEGARVEIGTSLGDGSVRVTIRDNGRGFSSEQLKRAFDPFYTTRQHEGGTGLGLSIVFGIVREHGGTVRIGNNRGSGATVTVEFPWPSVALNGSQSPRKSAKRHGV